MTQVDRIEVIFFDAVGTLIHLPEGAAHHYHIVGERHEIHLEKEPLARAFRTVWGEMPGRETTKAPRADDDKGWWREFVKHVLRLYTGGELPAAFEEYFEDLYHHFEEPGVWQPYPETGRILAELAPRFRLALVSNFDGRLRTVLGHLGMTDTFEHLFISSEVGADKPDPYIYELAMTTMGVSPTQALHVGDDPVRDWAGAEAAGMAVYRLNRPENSLEGLLRELS